MLTQTRFHRLPHLSCEQVYVAWLEGGTAVFAFRGTESAQDAKADIDARSTPVDWMSGDYPGIKGHMGAPPPAISAYAWPYFPRP